MKVSVSVSAPGLCPGLMLVRHKYTPPAVPLASPSHSEGNYPTGFAVSYGAYRKGSYNGKERNGGGHDGRKKSGT